ncbi:MAG: B12-binding domain-containing radical SAM protein [Thermoleophilia bacterium]
MKVLFVYPNVARARSPQVGVSSLSGALFDQGHECGLFDITFLSDAEIPAAYQRMLDEFQPDLIGVSARSTEWNTAAAIIRMGSPGAPIVVGGPHATIAPEEVIAEERVDMLVRGEGEEAIVDLANRMAAGRELADMPNLWLKRDGVIHKNDVRPLIQNLDSLPYPDWVIWDKRHFEEHYHRFFSPGSKIFGDLETSRGCPYACPYCLTPAIKEIYRGKGKFHREKSAGRIVEEIQRLRAIRHIDYVRFVDETFIVNRKRLKEFCELYADIRLPFSFSTRPETVDDGIMALLASAGANCVSFGLESGNEQYRRQMLKRNTRQEQVVSSVADARRHGIKTFAFVMIGLPGETRELIQDTIELIHLVDPDVFQVTIFYPFEGTPFYDYCLERGMLDADHERPTEIWKGSVLKQPQLPSDYLVRVRALMLVFAQRNRRWWPLARFLENNPASFRLWSYSMRATALSARVRRRLLPAARPADTVIEYPLKGPEKLRTSMETSEAPHHIDHIERSTTARERASET